MTANKYLKDRLPIGDPTYWTDAEVEELMESYATDRLDSYKESLRSAICEAFKSNDMLTAKIKEDVLNIIDSVTPK